MFRPSRIPPRAALLVALFATAAPLLAQERKSDSLFTVEKYLDFEQVADPQIAPDGSQIIYTRRHVNKLEDRFDAELWIMNADGTKNRFLTKGGGARWSPDGTRIAYLDDGEPSGTQIFVRWMDAEGATSQITRVDREPGATSSGRPTASRSGSACVVPKERTVAHRHARGAEGREVDRRRRKYETRCTIGRIASASPNPGFRHLFVVSGRRRHAAPDHQRRLERRRALRRAVGAVGWDWMPDGKTIVVAGDRRIPTADIVFRNSSILLDRRRDGREEAAHARKPDRGTIPVVSPDGQHIAFSGYPSIEGDVSSVRALSDERRRQRRAEVYDDSIATPAGSCGRRDGSGVYFSVARRTARRTCTSPPRRGAATRRHDRHAHAAARLSISRTGIGAGVRTASPSRRTSCGSTCTKRGTPSFDAAHARQRRRPRRA